MRFLLTLVCLLCLANLQGQSNAGFKPFPGDSARLYQFDLYQNYFADDQQEYKERLHLVKAFENLENRFANAEGKKNYQLILEYDSLLKKLGKHSAYLGMFAY